MSHLSELRERVEAARGPDRELDAAIFNATRSPDEDEASWSSPYQHEGVWGYTAPGNPRYGGRIWYRVPPLTASIDAALALVERDAGVQAEEIVRQALEMLQERGVWPFSRWMPLAILSALLRALEQKDPTHGG